MSFYSIERTHVGLRRKLNEDALASIADHGIWVVADGMGGHEAGEVASAAVVAAIRALPPRDDAAAMLESAVAALDAVNRDLVALASEGGERRTIGSTVVGLIIRDEQFRCFWAGDSRAYRVRDGGIVQLTRDHSLVQDLVAAGMIEPAEAESHPNANVITRAVGAAPTLQVESVAGVAFPGDIYLLASDGLTRMVSQVEILAALYSRPVPAALDHLIDLVLERGAPDNVSVIAVRVEPPAAGT